MATEKKRRGRPPLFGKAMTNAERQRRHRAKVKAMKRQMALFPAGN